MKAPTIAELLAEQVVQQALATAWTDSLSGDRRQRHEEGGWIYMFPATGEIVVRRAPAGGKAFLDLDSPPAITDAVVVGTFHTHPNPSSEGWQTGPSASDAHSAWLLGVPCLIVADDGIHTTGPDSRRGGLSSHDTLPP